MRRSASEIIRSIEMRIARLERKHIRPNLGISGFREYLRNLVENGGLTGEELRIMQMLFGQVKNTHDRELKYVGMAKTHLRPALEHLQSQINLIERLRTQTGGVVRMYDREVGASGDQTTLVSPAKEAEIVYNESIRQHEQEIHEIKELIEEAQSRLKVIHSTNLKNKP